MSVGRSVHAGGTTQAEVSYMSDSSPGTGTNAEWCEGLAAGLETDSEASRRGNWEAERCQRRRKRIDAGVSVGNKKMEREVKREKITRTKSENKRRRKTREDK